jgi:dihydropteroate synthase
VRTGPAGIAAAAQAGWAILVDLAGEDGGLAGQDMAAREAAVAAVCAWLGASVIRTRHVTEIRRSVEMTESILGRRPPAGTLRGLA